MFYDAIVRPHFKEGIIKVTDQSELETKLNGEVELVAEFDSGKFLALVSSWLPKFKAKGSELYVPLVSARPWKRFVVGR